MASRISSFALKLAFLSAGVIFVVVYEIVTHGDKETHLLDHIIVLLVLACLEQIVEFNLNHERPLDEEEQIETLVRQGSLGAGVKRISKEIKKSVGLHDKEFVIRHPNLAIWSYYHYWVWLVGEQEALSKKKKHLTLRVIHSNSMDPWKEHEYSRMLYAAHKRFTDNGGLVTRILCGSGHRPSDDVLEIAKRFASVGVNIRYCNVKDTVVPFTFAWDFLWVVETHDVVIWQALFMVRGGGVEKAIYQRGEKYDGHDIAELWSSLEANSRELKFTDEELQEFVLSLTEADQAPASH